MRTHHSRQPAPRLVWVLLALLLALWGLGLPTPAPGATAPASEKALYAFPSAVPPGVTPSGLLLATDGNFYGTTVLGGANDYGSVFRLTPTGTYTVIYSFAAGGAEGTYPTGGLIQGSDGNFYGTTSTGGLNDEGIVFRLTPAGTLTVLHAFDTTAHVEDGRFPLGGLVRDESSGTLYGTTSEGAGPGYGTVFQLTPTAPDLYTLSTIHTFSGGTDGAKPQGSLIRDPAGTLYGTTLGDGSSIPGTLFKLTPSSNPVTLTTLHEFNGTDGAQPQGTLLRDPAGNLYGLTYGSDACIAGSCPPSGNYGAVFQWTPPIGDALPAFTVLQTFTGANGAHPYGSLAQDPQGMLYGTTYTGVAALANGTAFRLTLLPSPAPPTFTPLYTFTGGADGGAPQAGLTRGTDGYFYGTTSQGGGTGKSGVAFVLRVGNPLTVSLDLAGTGTGTVTSTPAGITCPGTCTEWFLPTATVTLTAAAAVSSTFTGWSGDGITCPGTAPCAVPMTTAQNVTTTFTLKTFALTIQKGGTGGATGTVIGTINTTPTPLNCGGTCSASFDYNTQVTLTATAVSPAVFTGWSGTGSNFTCPGTGTCVVTMTEARTVTAFFNPPTVPLTVKVGGSSGGTIISSAPAISCPDSCTVNVASGATVTLTVTPGPGGTFKGWRDACTGGTCVLTNLTSAQTATAVFSKTFTDGTLSGLAIKAVHFTELREAINALRSHRTPVLPAFNWVDAAPAPNGVVRASHLLNLRSALSEIQTQTYGEAITPTTTPIRASHLTELRGFVRNLE